MTPPSSSGVVVAVNEYSDGSADKWPGAPFTVSDQDLYLTKIATLWMEERGEAIKGTKYILDHLPEGYRVYEKPRLKQEPGKRHCDKYLYGHPTGKPFDSPNKFFVHFSFIMNRNPDHPTECICVNCAAASARPRAGRARRSSGPTVPKDFEGTPDMHQIFFDRLKIEGKINEPFLEPDSFDWRMNRGVLEETLQGMSQEYSFVPRLGELALFYKTTPDDCEVHFEETSQTYKFRNTKTMEWGAIPDWRAGLVSEVPVPTEPIREEDLAYVTTKTKGITYHGFRLETYPAPNQDNKVASYDSKYVPMHHLRPFCFWKDFTYGLEPAEIHPSITNAMVITCSVATIDRHQFEGKWPNAKLFVGGIWIGHELLIRGDAVRLMPDPENGDGMKVSYVLVVEHMYVYFTNLDKPDDVDMTILIRGKRYTAEPELGWGPKGKKKLPQISEQTIKNSFPSGMYGFKWWWAQNPENLFLASADMILGRCYEAVAMEVWTKFNANIDFCGENMQDAMAFSQRSDVRLLEQPGEFYWAETRNEQLDLGTVNYMKVEPRHPETRQPGLWRKVMRILDKQAAKDDPTAVDSGNEEDDDQGGDEAAKAAPTSSQNAGHGLIAAARVHDPLEDASSGDDDDPEDGEEDAAGGAAAPQFGGVDTAGQSGDDEVQDTIQQMIDGQILPELPDEVSPAQDHAMKDVRQHEADDAPRFVTESASDTGVPAGARAKGDDSSEEESDDDGEEVIPGSIAPARDTAAADESSEEESADHHGKVASNTDSKRRRV